MTNGLLRCADSCHCDGVERLDRCLQIKARERKKGQMDRRAQSVRSGAKVGSEWINPVPRGQVRSDQVRSVQVR